MKSLVAVLVGYLVFGVSTILLFTLAGVDPSQEPELGFRVWSTVYGCVFAFAGGYMAARIAGNKELMHAVAVAFILALLATVSLMMQVGHGSVWSQVAALGFMTPAAILGGVLRAQQMRVKA